MQDVVQVERLPLGDVGVIGQEGQQGVEEGGQVGGPHQQVEVVGDLDAADQHERGVTVPTGGKEQRGGCKQLAVLVGSDEHELGIRPLAAAAGLPPEALVFVAHERNVRGGLFEEPVPGRF